ncbi:hypothetical protein Tco_0493608 [Tanacetum coccineum]
MCAPPRSRAPRNQAMFGESDGGGGELGGSGGELGGGGCESMYSIMLLHVLQVDSMKWDDQREDEEVATVDGVFEGAFGHLVIRLALEMEALVDAMEVYGG